MPFRETSMQMLYNNVMKGDFDPIPSRYSKDLMEIIKLILIKNPKQRPSAEDLLKNRIIVQKMEKLGMEKSFWVCEDEKAMLMRTIKLPGNLNQMNQVNRQLPRKNYKKDRYQNQMEMLENDEYETAKNSFYHPKDKNKLLKKEKSIHNLNNLNTNKDLYNDQKPLRPIMDKKYMNNESNITELNSNKNYPVNNKYNYKNNFSYNNYTINNNNRSINIVKNNNNSRQLQLLSLNKNKNINNINNIYPLNCNKENEVDNKTNNHNTINKK
jgi:NIMA (never in mitosis gene a)-related kinase